MTYHLLFIFVTSLFFISYSTAQLAAWPELSNSWDQCPNDKIVIAIVPFFESVQVKNDVVFISFGYRSCNPCAITILLGESNYISLVDIDSSTVNDIPKFDEFSITPLPVTLYPGYHRHAIVINGTLKSLLNKKPSWTLRANTASGQYITANSNGAGVISDGKLPFLVWACTNPCTSEADVGFAKHPDNQQVVISTAATATCGAVDWPSKYVLIVGGRTGMGNSVYRQLKELGTNVKFTSRFGGEPHIRSSPQLATMVNDMINLNVDVTRESDIARLFDLEICQWPSLDFVFYTPSQHVFGPMTMLDGDDLMDSFKVNLMGVQRVYKHATPYMVPDDGIKKFVVWASTAYLSPSPDVGGYTVGKSAVVAWADAASYERIAIQQWNLVIRDKHFPDMSNVTELPHIMAVLPHATGPVNFAQFSWIASRHINQKDVRVTGKVLAQDVDAFAANFLGAQSSTAWYLNTNFSTKTDDAMDQVINTVSIPSKYAPSKVVLWNRDPIPGYDTNPSLVEKLNSAFLWKPEQRHLAAATESNIVKSIRFVYGLYQAPIPTSENDKKMTNTYANAAMRGAKKFAN